MFDLTKLSVFLDSVVEQDPNYDYACYIKEKLAEDHRDPFTVNNGDNYELAEPDVTTATPKQQTADNFEGQLMDDAFQELSVQNMLDEEKNTVGKPKDSSTAKTNNVISNNFIPQQKVARVLVPGVTFYEALRARFLGADERFV
jgi:hypothetical protein